MPIIEEADQISPRKRRPWRLSVSVLIPRPIDAELVLKQALGYGFPNFPIQRSNRGIQQRLQRRRRHLGGRKRLQVLGKLRLEMLICHPRADLPLKKEVKPGRIGEYGSSPMDNRRVVRIGRLNRKS